MEYFPQEIREIYDKIPLFIKDYILTENWYKEDLTIGNNYLFIGYSKTDISIYDLKIEDWLCRFQSGNQLQDIKYVYKYLLDNNLLTK